MKQATIIYLAEYREQISSPVDPQCAKETHQLDELSLAILSLIKRLRDCNPLKQTG